jgi:exopolysaccharide biosynthesis polyprenyl glycosylphosphotransferase
MNTDQLSVDSPPLAPRAPARSGHNVVPLLPLAARPGQLAWRISRALDVAVAALLLAVLAVPMLLIAALVKLTSHGPALYRQQRVGLGGKPFVMYKFRTMGIDAERETGPVWSKRGDPRCTPLGRVLRRLCLDELPQLFNVLAGDMSLVGPRPERPFFVREFSRQIPGYQQRHQVRPGITGWAQINGWRGDTSLEKRVEFDLHYIRHWSLWLNLKIMLLTPFKLLVDRSGC